MRSKIALLLAALGFCSLMLAGCKEKQEPASKAPAATEESEPAEAAPEDPAP